MVPQIYVLKIRSFKNYSVLKDRQAESLDPPYLYHCVCCTVVNANPFKVCTMYLKSAEDGPRRKFYVLHVKTDSLIETTLSLKEYLTKEGNCYLFSS